MDVALLRTTLQALQDAGVAEATVPLGDQSLVVKFAPPSRPVSANPFVDKDGKPINLDEGLPPLAQDPDERDPIEAANFAKVKPGS